ncbi:Protein Associated with Differentiation [Trypanosoma brucei equiperdum]|uniref:Protein Associated with Differentiation n=1 Tax=Trypanosoma brucei equiperdum TaxID=630700 RepID=A0A3L6LBB7_9TRYP|nr:Protein Associated with Differentiation [Trypanosoma brucei equiperdum]
MSAPVDNVVVERLSTANQKPINEPRRFALLVLGTFCCICTSFMYAFNLISGAMQERYDLTQRDLSTITTVGIAVGYFLLPYSFIFDYLGPKPIFVIAMTVFCLGALLFALTFQEVIEGSVVRLSVYNGFLTLGCMLFDLGSVVTVLSVFPSNRGAVMAIVKTFTGLGSAIVGSIQLAFFSKSVANYFFFLMSFSLVVGTLAVVFMNLPPFHLTGYQKTHLDEEEKAQRLARKGVYLKQKAPMWRFVHGFAILVTLIVFLPLQGALVAYLKLGSNFKVGFAVTVIVLTVIFPFMAFPLTTFDGKRPHDDSEGETCCRREVAEEVSASDDTGVETDVDYIAPQFQETFIEGLKTARLWCLLWSIFCCVGVHYVIIYNARFIYTALAGEVPDDALNALLTVLNGVGSAVGRLCMSYFEVWSQKRRAEDRVPITLSMFVPSVCIITMLTLILTLPKAALPLPYFIAALSNGFTAAIIALVTRTIFAKDPAKHYNFCFLGSVLSAIFLNRLLYGEWYTQQADKLDQDVCTERVCVVMPLAFMLGLAFPAFATSTYLHLQYRNLCMLALDERRRIREGERGPKEPSSCPKEPTRDAREAAPQ